MADYHILTQAVKKNTVQVVFHIPVPAVGTNEAEILWRDAIVLEKGGSDNITSVLSDILPEELTLLKSGALLEVPTSVRFNSVNSTTAEKKAKIEEEYNDSKAKILSDKQIILQWIGFKANVVA